MAIAALTLFAASSCSKEQIVATAEGEETLVSFTIASPVISTKAIADGNTVDKVDVNVYKEDGTLISDNTISKTVDMAGGKATYTARLVTGQTYDFVFWAYNEAGQHYTLDATTKKVTVNYNGAANDETRDAFYKYLKAKKITGPIKETITLNRPFAQLNFGVNEADIAAAAAAGISVKKSAVKVVGVPNVLDLTDGSADGDVTVTYTLADCPAEKLVVKNVEYGYVSMGYILAGKDEKITAEASLTIADAAGAELCEPKVVPAVPLQGNWRTNILGNLFTSDVEYNIVIEPSFTDETNIDLEKIDNPTSLKALMLAGGSAVLTSDIDITDTNEIFVGEGKEVTLDLNGHNITNTEDIWFESGDESVPNKVALFIVSGKLTLKGQGSVKAKENDCYTFNVKNGGHLVIEDGEYVGNVSVIQVQEGLAEVKGGKFSLAQKWPTAGEYGCDYMINMIDKAYKDGTAKAVVTGGQFVGFNPADNTSENPKDNYCPDGHVAVQEGEVFTVVKGTAATDEESLKAGLSKTNGITTVNGAVDVSYTVVSKKTTLNLVGGGTLNGTEEESFRVNKGGNLTINGNGKIVAVNSLPEEQTSAISIRNGGKVNIYDGVTLDGGSGSKGNNAVRIVYGTANIYGGYFHSGLDKDGNSSEVIYLESAYLSSSKCYLNIYGGVFECDGDAKYLINCQDKYRSKCTVKIMGGTFVGFNPANNTAEGANTNFVADGYKAVETTYNGKAAWEVVKE